jgi:hypothetical protein
VKLVAEILDREDKSRSIPCSPFVSGLSIA